MKKNKTAIVYNKWLPQLGGGEVVACSTAKILKNSGYKVIFLTGREISKETIKKRLGIDLSGIKFKSVWNDELEIKELTQNKDLFLNFTFMDYTRGYAKKNIFYTLFPTKTYNTLRGKIVNTILLPVLAQSFIPQESIEGKVQFAYHHVSYSLDNPVQFAFYYLSIGKVYKLEFEVYIPSLSKSTLEKLDWKLDGAKIKHERTIIDHRNNILKISASVTPFQTTVYLEVMKQKKTSPQSEKNDIYLIYKPQLYYFFKPLGYFDWFQQRLNRRFRAGLFRNDLKRIHSYDYIIADSKFTKHWIKNYWKRDAPVIYPPVNLLSRSSKTLRLNKENWISSIGRFFTTGHGKKQEILIRAFKKFYDSGNTGWQLHLVGGAGKESKTQKFIKELKAQSKGYPIFFHLNTSRRKTEQILHSSKIYWHATGYGENEHRNPILFEHFGIAPVEAISAGCIPILYNGGGLVDTIQTLELDENKHLFRTIDELVEKTILFTKTKKKKLIDWDKVYRLLDENYSKKVFEKKFIELIQRP